MGIFVERLAAGATGTMVDGAADIRPALTPGMIPEALRLPREGRSPSRPLPAPEDALGSALEPTEPGTEDRTPPQGISGKKSVAGEVETGRGASGAARSARRTLEAQARKEAAADAAELHASAGPEVPREILEPANPDGGAASEESEKKKGRQEEPEESRVREAEMSARAVQTAGEEEEARQGKSPSELEEAGRISSASELRSVRPTPRAGPGTTRAETTGGESPAGSKAEVVSSPASHRARLEATDGANQEPTVTINIGRIEVRAVNPETPPTDDRGPALSLDEYMKRRNKRDQ